MSFSILIYWVFFHGFLRSSLSICVSMLFSGILTPFSSVYHTFIFRDYDTLFICVSMLFPGILMPFSIFVLMLFFQRFRCPSLSLYGCFFFQGFRRTSLSVYRCFWLPSDGYLWEINKRSCLPFICCDSSRNADHFIHCSFTKLEVKTLYFVLYRILTYI